MSSYPAQQIFASAARTFLTQVRAIPADAYPGPGLGDWDLRALVGHTTRSLVTVETYLGQPAPTEDIPSPEAYYVAISGILRADTDAAAIVERGRAAGAAMGDDPAAYVAGLVERVVPMTERDDDPLISTIAGGMRLRQYLPTRTFELVVHGLDIARALDREPPDFGPEVLAATARLAAGAAVGFGRGVPLILALTGRAGLPAGFSVV